MRTRSQGPFSDADNSRSESRLSANLDDTTHRNAGGIQMRPSRRSFADDQDIESEYLQTSLSNEPTTDPSSPRLVVTRSSSTSSIATIVKPAASSTEGSSDASLGTEAKAEEGGHAAHQRRARLRSPWHCSPLTFFSTCLAALILLAIIHSFLTLQLDPKGCAGTLMAPGYAKLADFDTEHTRFASKYSLYLYRELSVDQDTRVGWDLSSCESVC